MAAHRFSAKLTVSQVSDGELMELFRIADADQNGSIEMHEFIQLLTDPATAKREQQKRAASAVGQVYARILATLTAEKRGSQTEIIRQFARHAQDGRLDRSALRNVVKDLGTTVTDEELDEVVSELSTGTNDGTITSEVFAKRLRQARLSGRHRRSRRSRTQRLTRSPRSVNRRGSPSFGPIRSELSVKRGRWC